MKSAVRGIFWKRIKNSEILDEIRQGRWTERFQIIHKIRCTSEKGVLEISVNTCLIFISYSPKNAFHAAERSYDSNIINSFELKKITLNSK